MSKVLIEEQTLYDIGDAIRAKTSDKTYKPGEMAAAISMTGVDPYPNYLFLSGPGLSRPSNSDTVRMYPLVNRLYFSVDKTGPGDALLASAAEVHDGTLQEYGYLYRDGFQIGVGLFAPKITAGTYNKLMIDIKCEPRSSTGWWQEHICFSTSASVMTSTATPANPQPADIIKRVYLASSGMTVESLNAQSGVIATRTDNKSLPRQIVEIDVSDISEDFYVSFYNCDIQMSIYAMWFE